MYIDKCSIIKTFGIKHISLHITITNKKLSYCKQVVADAQPVIQHHNKRQDTNVNQIISASSSSHLCATRIDALL